MTGVTPTTARGRPEASLDAAGFSFLVVDDDDQIRRTVASAIAHSGGRVYSAADGVEALALLERHRPDVLVSDIRMPRMDGLELLRRARDTAPDLEVVLITGFADKDVVIDALRAGASSFLEKPFGMAALFEHLRVVVERLRLGRENEHLRAQREEEVRLAAMGRVLSGLAREVLLPLDVACQGLEMARYELARLDTEVADPGVSGGRAEEWLAEVGDCLRRIQERVLAIELFLDPSRPLSPAACRVADAVSRATAAAEPRRPESAALRVEVEEGLEVLCDPTDLQTGLERVLANAYEALAAKGKTVTVSARRAAGAAPWVEIRVTDDGPGMSPELCSRVVVPFFTTRRDALGFGLPVAFEAARRNGGTLSVESVEGEGTTVVLRLPPPGGVERFPAPTEERPS